MRFATPRRAKRGSSSGVRPFVVSDGSALPEEPAQRLEERHGRYSRTQTFHWPPDVAVPMLALRNMATANRRLAQEIAEWQEELRISRARVQSAADNERRRIGRDLHDGAQQRIVGLRIKLELVREKLVEHGSDDAHLLDDLGDEIIAILDELRALAHGIYPAVLAAQGPEEALRAAARRAPIGVTIQSDGLPRCQEDVEAAVYFCCLEAMQNAAKHGGPDVHVAVTLSHDPMRFEVRDDGVGFDESITPAGAGFIHMHDRLAAFDGELEISSTPGRGTTVRGRIPNAES